MSNASVDLPDPEGNAQAGRTLDVLEIDENALRRLGTEIHRVGGVLRDALESFEHEVEFPYRSKVGVAADGAGDFMLDDKRLQRVVVHALDADGKLMLFGVFFNEIVRAVAGLAGFAIHEGIGEAAEVARRFPGAGVHENGAVHARVVGIFLHKLFPPRLFDVVFQLHAQRAVIPCIGETAVNFAARKDKAPVFAKGNKFFHRHRSFFCHDPSPV